jgi:hypothetical protein
MSDEKDFELDNHALAMIAAYRQEESLPTDVRERVWDRVEGDVDGAAPVASATPGSSAAKWGVVLFAAAAVIAAVVLGAQALTPTQESTGTPQQAPYGVTGEPEGGVVEEEKPLHVERMPVAAPSPPPAPEMPAAIEAAPIEPTPAVEPEVRTSKPRTRRAPPRTDARPTEPAPALDPAPAIEPAPAPVDTLAEETRLLERARRALHASRPGDALVILDECKRRFPAGRLAPERAALRAIALCDAGRSDEGSTAADAFLAAHSGHALASRVRRACDR